MPIERIEPCVSVLMTTFNGARLIRASIDSVLAQTFKDFELIVVDDASTDEGASCAPILPDQCLHRHSPHLGPMPGSTTPDVSLFSADRLHFPASPTRNRAMPDTTLATSGRWRRGRGGSCSAATSW
jgi:hypothetical protein